MSSSYSSLDWVLSHWVHFTVEDCRGYGDSLGYGYGGCDQSHGLMGILCGFLNRSEIKWKRFKYRVNATADV